MIYKIPPVIRKFKRAWVDGVRIQIRCAVERHGTDYGGWVICPLYLDAKSVVYSFGVGEDISFDLSIISKFGARVHAFDPTPKSRDWVKSQSLLPSMFHFHEYGLADFDGVAYFNPPVNHSHVSYTLLDRPETANNTVAAPVFRLKTIMENLHHSRIDLLKMDIEGAEYGVITDIAKSNVRIRQILVEFHDRFEGVGWGSTKLAIVTLKQMGYKIFSVSENNTEFSFISDGKFDK